MHFSKSIIGGIGAGLATILLFGLLYKFDPNIMLYNTTYWGSLIFYVIAILMVLLRTKSLQRGILPYRQALRLGFVTFLIANILFFVFYYWLFTTDPSLLDLQIKQVEEFAETLPKGSWGREQFEQTKSDNIAVTIKGTLLRYARGAIGGFFLAAFLALLTKQEK